MSERRKFQPEDMADKTDRHMTEAEADVFSKELLRKRLQTAIEVSGEDKTELLNEAKDFVDKWLALLDKKTKTDSEVELEEIEIDIKYLFEDNLDRIKIFIETLDQIEIDDFNNKIDTVVDEQDDITKLLDDHIDRYGYSKRDLPPKLALKLWKRFGKDERIKPYVHAAFDRGESLISLMDDGLTEREITQILMWIDEK